MTMTVVDWAVRDAKKATPSLTVRHRTVAPGIPVLAARPLRDMKLLNPKTPANPRHAEKAISLTMIAVAGKLRLHAPQATRNQSAQPLTVACGTMAHAAPRTELT